jgi:alcohol dehydrogenase class IV
MAERLMMKQDYFFGQGRVTELRQILSMYQPRRILLVTGRQSYALSGAQQRLDNMLKDTSVIHFSDFAPNPTYEDVSRGIALMADDVDLVIAVGGGSVLDVAKAVNALAVQDGDPIGYITNQQSIQRKGRPLVAIPTTTGSGSEATHFVVLYVDGKKYSLAHPSLFPDYAIVDPQLSLSLPRNVAAATSLDAFCQAVESFWSIHATEASQGFARQALSLILDHIRASVNTAAMDSRSAMAQAAYLSGQAINITKTTAAHALSYFLTMHFGLAHGHAVALTLGEIWEFNAGVTDHDCQDQRGVDYVRATMSELLDILQCPSPQAAKDMIKSLMRDCGLPCSLPECGLDTGDIRTVADHVNLERLKNNPRRIDQAEMLVDILTAQVTG